MIGAIIEARYASTRLPYKVLRPLAQKPMLHWVIKRAQASQFIRKVVVAMPDTPDNAPVFQVATESGAEVVTGPQDNVLLRDIYAARAYDMETVVRLTGDNPFIDPQIIDQAIDYLLSGGSLDMVSTCRGEATYPRGIAVEVMDRTTLEALKSAYYDASTIEHTTVPLYTEERWKHEVLPSPWPAKWREKLRLTVDTYEDYHLAMILYDVLGPMCRLGEVIAFCEKHPGLLEINRNIQVKAVRG